MRQQHWPPLTQELLLESAQLTESSLLQRFAVDKPTRSSSTYRLELLSATRHLLREKLDQTHVARITAVITKYYLNKGQIELSNLLFAQRTFSNVLYIIHFKKEYICWTKSQDYW